jgi:hypothetical protein
MNVGVEGLLCKVVGPGERRKAIKPKGMIISDKEICHILAHKLKYDGRVRQVKVVGDATEGVGSKLVLERLEMNIIEPFTKNPSRLIAIQ